MFLQPAGVAPPRHLIPAGVQRLPADRLYGTGPELAAGGGYSCMRGHGENVSWLGMPGR
jgi:hypothetical protein